MAIDRKRRLNIDEKKALLLQYRRSGSTQGDFCREANLPLSTLQSWLKRERRESRFTELEPPKTLSTTVELVFPDGAALRIRSN